jgi:hypothetical protein
VRAVLFDVMNFVIVGQFVNVLVELLEDGFLPLASNDVGEEYMDP